MPSGRVEHRLPRKRSHGRIGGRRIRGSRQRRKVARLHERANRTEMMHVIPCAPKGIRARYVANEYDGHDGDAYRAVKNYKSRVAAQSTAACAPERIARKNNRRSSRAKMRDSPGTCRQSQGKTQQNNPRRFYPHQRQHHSQHGIQRRSRHERTAQGSRCIEAKRAAQQYARKRQEQRRSKRAPYKVTPHVKPSVEIFVQESPAHGTRLCSNGEQHRAAQRQRA